MNTDPPTCGACSRAALTAPCARGCGRLAVVCACPDVLSLDGVCAVCAFDDDAMNASLGLDGADQFAVYLGTLGRQSA